MSWILLHQSIYMFDLNYVLDLVLKPFYIFFFLFQWKPKFVCQRTGKWVLVFKNKSMSYCSNKLGKKCVSPKFLFITLGVFMLISDIRNTI